MLTPNTNKQKDFTWNAEVSEESTMRLGFSSHVLGHALIYTLVWFSGVLDHEGSIIEQIQPPVIFHIQWLAENRDEQLAILYTLENVYYFLNTLL